jgi:hypothetical protein
MTEKSVSVMGGEALVEKMVGKSGMGFAEGFSENDRFEGLRAVRAVCMEWVADDEDLDTVLADEASDSFEVGALAGAVEGKERLRGETKRVSDRKTDALVTDVERECAGRGF